MLFTGKLELCMKEKRLINCKKGLSADTTNVPGEVLDEAAQPIDLVHVDLVEVV